MILNCTKKLADFLKIKPELQEASNPLFSWHANIVAINRRKAIVFVNDSNRYTVVLYGIKATHIKSLDSIIKDGIHQALLSQGISNEVASKYIADLGEITFSKTQNRTLVARMNKGAEYTQWFEDLIVPDEIFQSSVSKKCNYEIFAGEKNQYFHPYEEIIKDLEALYQTSAIKQQALELMVKLDLENQDVWRKLIVPENTTFLEFHYILQKAFGWTNSHLAQFEVELNDFDEINIVLSDEDMEFASEDVKMVYGETATLKEYMPKYEKIKYIYDYGDYWEHIITAQKVISDYDKTYAICLDGSGDRPPEDVGGEGGYEDFLHILSNPDHTEYRFIKEWFEGQQECTFDIDYVNKALKYNW